MRQLEILIAGGGIGGLAAALACARAGWSVRLFERTSEFSEVGAGIQIGPNVVRILHAWGLQEDLDQVAAFPDHLQVRCALGGQTLGKLPFAGRCETLYGAPYATIHRADMQQLLLRAAQQQGGVSIQLSTTATSVSQSAEVVTLHTTAGKQIEGDALLGADGLWGVVRHHFLPPAAPRVSGHLAYRALLPQNSLPHSLQSQHVTVWLGPRLHAVTYPVRRGELLNVVVIVQDTQEGDLTNWDHCANAAQLQKTMGSTCTPLQDLIQAIPHWRLWSLCDRPPVPSADAMAHGRVALLGDAAHPTRPYLAQGACMAIEDAHELTRALSMHDIEVPIRLRRYALNRWQRCARIQARSERNGRIFHAEGLMRTGRDLSLRLLGHHLLDVPWLYRGSQI